MSFLLMGGNLKDNTWTTACGDSSQPLPASVSDTEEPAAAGEENYLGFERALCLQQFLLHLCNSAPKNHTCFYQLMSN